MYREVMLDCETLGVASANPVVFAVAGVKFNRRGQDTVQSIMDDADRQITIFLNIEEQLKKGHTIDASTLKWWMEQGEQAKYLFGLLPTGPIAASALWPVNAFVSEAKRIWSLGAADDLKWLHALYDSFNVPFFLCNSEKREYRRSRCLRTIFDLVGTLPEMDLRYTFGGKEYTLQAHVPLHDCIKQVLRLQYCYRILNQAGIDLPYSGDSNGGVQGNEGATPGERADSEQQQAS